MLGKEYENWLGARLANGESYVDAKTYAEMNSHNVQEVLQTRSVGLGDTVAKITHATGLVKLAELYTQITGKDCGCKSRQEFLNKLFPYGVKEENE